jgi:hypothetical protein
MAFINCEWMPLSNRLAAWLRQEAREAHEAKCSRGLGKQTQF